MGTLLSDKRLQEIAALHAGECELCPLASIKSNRNPNMPATGASRPLIYMLGEAPGRTEDDEGEQFVGESGQLLRPRIPREFRDKVRFNNVVRTRPLRNKTPEWQAVEACRPSIIRDIEASKPKAIFGFGNVPLEWVCGLSGIMGWRGRRMPIQIGKHKCWYYAMLHPAFVLRGREGSEEERVFGFDLKRAFSDVKEGLPEPIVHTKEEVYADTTLSTDLEEILLFLQEAASSAKLVGIDYETNCLRPYAADAKILSAAVATEEHTIAFPFEHPEAEWQPLALEDLNLAWRTFLRTCKGRKIAHNLSFELEWSAVKFGKDLARTGVWDDTATQASVIDERKGGGKPGALSLEFLVQQYFGFNIKKLAGVDRTALADTPLEKVLRYNAPDAKYALELFKTQRELIEQEELDEVYKISNRRIPTVVLSQMKGVPVDQVAVKELKKKYGKLLDDTDRAIKALPIIKQFEKEEDKPFNPASNPQVLHVFATMLKRKECHVQDKYTKQPKLSADRSVLEQIDHPLAGLLLKRRVANKMKSTYVDPLEEGNEESVLYPDGCLHASFNTIFAETGRLSSDSPNLQNFPKRSDQNREVRKSIVAPPGHLIVAFDYGQIEARVIAMFTHDKAFCKALWERYDVHGEWAERIAREYPKRIGGRKMLTDKKAMKDFRTDIKNQWTFPLFFGASLMSASGYLNIPIDVLEPLYKSFWRQFSGVKAWQEKQLKFYRDYGYVSCLTGRRRRAPLSVNQVLNSPVQGTAAEIVMDAMSRLSELNVDELQPEINVHDDLTFLRVRENTVDQFVEKVLNVMLDVPFKWVNVPITVEVSIGENWAELEEVGGAFSSDEWFK